MKDHELAVLVRRLCDVAREYGSSQELRPKISKVVREALGDKRVEPLQQLPWKSCEPLDK